MSGVVRVDTQIICIMEVLKVDLLLPAITGITPVTETLRDTYALSPKNGGLGIVNPATVADSEYRFSTIINRELVSAILENREEFNPDSQSTLKAKRECKAAKTKMVEDRKFHLLSTCSTSLKRQITLLSEKGASVWLSTLPLKNCGFVLSKQQFQDGLRLRYNIPLEGVSLECACGKPNSIDHALICKLGGYTHLRHNQLRDTLSNLLVLMQCAKMLSRSLVYFQSQTKSSPEEPPSNKMHALIHPAEVSFLH